MDNRDIADRGYVITGAAGGIADAVVATFAEAGARLALVDVSMDVVRERAARHEALAIEADLTDTDAAADMVARASSGLGRIDGLIHTTGGFATAPADETDADLYDHLLDLNLRTLVVTTAAVLPIMLEQRRGFLAAFSAAPGWHRSGGSGMSVYAAAKAAVAGYLHAVGDECADRGIATAIVYPMGVVETEGNRKAMPDADRSAWIDPVEIARALLFAAGSGPRGRLAELPIFPAS
jgi:NADP-dependent 3-hydroxy acid dehydrogenase YdfG